MSFTPFSARSTAVAADFHHALAALYANIPRNFGNSYYDAQTVENTPISSIRASGS